MSTTQAPILGGGPTSKPYVLLQSIAGVSLILAATLFLARRLVELEHQSHQTLVAMAFPLLGITAIVTSLPFLFYIFYADQFPTQRGRWTGPLFSATDYLLILKRILSAVSQANQGGKIRAKDL